MVLKIELKEVPVSVNHIWKHSNRGGFVRTYLTAAGREFKDRLGQQVPKDFIPLDEPLRIIIILTFPDKRKRDIDNYCKGILDALKNRAYTDDSIIQEMFVKKKYEKNQPNIEIIVETMGGL